MDTLQERTIRCADCGEDFVFTVGEQEFFRVHGLTNPPTRCKRCREARKARKPQGRSAGPRAGRALHKAVCADCGAATEVPFTPSAARPVYCRNCFQNHRPGGRPERAVALAAGGSDGRRHGEVKWFDAERGFGFILGEGGEEIFVHFSAIQGEGGQRGLTGGDRVEFDVVEGDRGRKAANVARA